MGVKELLKSRGEEILRLASQHGARNVRIFGSVARGEASLASNADFFGGDGGGPEPLGPCGAVADLEELLAARWTCSRLEV